MERMRWDCATEQSGHRVTRFYACYREGDRNYRLLFGEPVGTIKRVGQGGLVYKVYSFAPGARFGIDLWRRNAYGTRRWRCFVCKSIEPGEAVQAIPFVDPGAHVLMHTRGAAQSRLFLLWLRSITQDGIDPVTCPPETFEAAHFRLQGLRADRTPPQRLSGKL